MYTNPPPLIPHRVFDRFHKRAILQSTAASVADYMHPKCQEAWLRRLRTPLPNTKAFAITVNQNSK